MLVLSILMFYYELSVSIMNCYYDLKVEIKTRPV